MSTSVLPDNTDLLAKESTWVPTALDRCDACGAQAYMRYELASGELYFCIHHGRENKQRLSQVALTIQDESARLLAE